MNDICIDKIPEVRIDSEKAIHGWSEFLAWAETNDPYWYRIHYLEIPSEIDRLRLIASVLTLRALKAESALYNQVMRRGAE